METTGFAEDEFSTVRQYLADGGRLVVGRELTRFLFPGEAGRKFLQTLVGTGPTNTKPNYRILQTHPWIEGLDSTWIEKSAARAITASDEFNVIGDPETKRSILTRAPVGEGMFVYLGWEAARVLPHGRLRSTPEQEAAYESHYRVLERMVADLLR